MTGNVNPADRPLDEILQPDFTEHGAPGRSPAPADDIERAASRSRGCTTTEG